MSELWLKVDVQEMGYDLSIPMEMMAKASRASVIILMVCGMVQGQYAVTRTQYAYNFRFDVDGDYVTLKDCEAFDTLLDPKVCRDFLQSDSYYMVRDYTAPNITFH